MDAKLEIQITSDLTQLEKSMARAEQLLIQHQRNFDNVGRALSQSQNKYQNLANASEQLTKAYESGRISMERYARSQRVLQQAMDRTDREVIDLQREQRRLQDEIQKTTRATQQQTTATNQQASAMGRAGKVVNGHTGRMANLGKVTRVNAVPAMTSFSQIIQDAPYGIQGVANNIQQLTMQLGWLSTSAGGTTKAMKAMLASLAGPAGVLFAVSLVTSAWVKYEDQIKSFFGAVSSLTKAQQEYNANAQAEISTLNALLGVARDETLNKEQHQRAIEQLNRDYGDYLGKLTEEGVQSEETAKKVDRLTEALIRQAQVRGAQNLIEEKTRDLVEETMRARERAEMWVGTSVAQRRAALREELEGLNQLTRSLEQQQAAGADVADALSQVASKAEGIRVQLFDPDAMREGMISDYVAQETAKAQSELEGLQRLLQTTFANYFEVSVSIAPDEKDAREKIKSLYDILFTGYGKPEVPFEAMPSVSGEMVKTWEEHIERLERAREQYTRADAEYAALTKQIDNLRASISLWNGEMQGAEFPMVNMTKQAQKMAEAVEEAARRMDRAIQTAINNMIRNMMDGKFEAEDFAKSVLSSLLSIAVSSMMGPAGGIFGALLGGGAQLSVSHTHNIVSPRVSTGASSAIAAASGGAQLSVGVPDVKIQGQDLLVVFDRAAKQKSRAT